MPAASVDESDFTWKDLLGPLIPVIVALCFNIGNTLANRLSRYFDLPRTPDLHPVLDIPVPSRSIDRYGYPLLPARTRSDSRRR